MGALEHYRDAKKLQPFVDGDSRIEIHRAKGSYSVGLSIELSDPKYARSYGTWEGYDYSLGQSVFAEVVDKLAPAIESLFIRRLGERIEEMRQAAVADAHERRERQDQNWIKSLIELGVTRDELGISEEDEEENKEQ